MCFIKQIKSLFFSFCLSYSIESGAGKEYEYNTQEINNDSGDSLDINEKQVDIIPKKVEEILLVEWTWNTEKNGDQKENYLLFKEFINTLDNTKKEFIFNCIQRIDSNDIGAYIYDNGYIIKEGITLNNFLNFVVNKGFLIKETIGFKEEKIEDKKETIKNKEESKENINLQIEKLKLLSKFHIKNEGFNELIKSAFELSDKDAKKEKEVLLLKIQNYLDKNLEKVAKELYDSDGKDGEAYKSFKSFAIGINSNFSKNFDNFEKTVDLSTKELIEKKEDALQAMVVAGMGNGEIEKYGSVIVTKGEGKVITMDLSDVPPSRHMSLEGSDYNLETDLPVGDFYKAISVEGLEYEKGSKKYDKINSIVNGIKKLQNDPEILKKESFTNIKAIISQNSGIKIEDIELFLSENNINSKELLVNAIKTNKFDQIIENGLKEVEKQEKLYKEALNKKMKSYKEALNEKDKQTKEVLKFLSSIGFDMIPQSVTDMIIKNLNGNNGLRNMLGFNEKIDLANGSLGLQKDNDRNNIGSKEKQLFAEFVNIMISGQKGEPINIDNIAKGSGLGIADKSKFKASIADGIGSSSGNIIGMKNLNNYLNKKETKKQQSYQNGEFINYTEKTKK